MRKNIAVFVFCSVTSIILLSSLIIKNNQLIEQNNKVTKDYEVLNYLHTNLFASYTTLQNDNAELKDNLRTIRENYTTCNIDKIVYQTKVGQLEDKVEKLNAEIEELNKITPTPTPTNTPIPTLTPVPIRENENGKLTKRGGVYTNKNGILETYYNLNMKNVIRYMREKGYSESDYSYWVRDDGVKMFGDYVMVAAAVNKYPYGTIVYTSLGDGIVVDTGDFAKTNPNQFDIAVNW